MALDVEPAYLHGFGWGGDNYEFEWEPPPVEKIGS